jgi:hypothetical protein
MSLREDVKNIIRGRISEKQQLIKLNRLGTVAQINPDGTALILVDGQLLSARTLYPMVQGQQAVVLPDNTGNFSAAPTSPAPIPPEPQEPDYFTGGFIRWGIVSGPFAGGLTFVSFQDTGTNSVYSLDFSDLPGYSPLAILTFSPDGTRVAVVFQNNSASRAHIRVYSLGQKLTGTNPVTSPNGTTVFTLTAPLLIDIVRTSIQPTSQASPASSFVADAFITDDTAHVWWMEVQYAPFAVGTGVNGQIVNTVHLFQAIAGGGALEVGHPITTVFFQTTPNSSATTFRAMWSTGNKLLSVLGNGSTPFPGLAGGGIWSPDRFQFLGCIEDPQNGFGSVEGVVVTGTGVAQNNANNQTIGPPSAAIFLGSGHGFTENGYNLVTNSVSVASGGITLVKQSTTFSGDFQAYPGDFPANANFAVGTPPKTPSFSKKFRASPFANIVNRTTGPSNTSFFYQDITSGVNSEGYFLTPPVGHALDAVPVGSVIMLTSSSSGFILDTNSFPGPYLRAITSADGGLTWTADPISKAIKITPGRALNLNTGDTPFPPLAYPANTTAATIKGVSTR